MIKFPQELQNRLIELWNRYKIYAESCIKTGVFPAQFGATSEEKELKEQIELYYENY